MYIGKVIGSVVSTKKDATLVGEKLLVVQQINSNQSEVRRQEVVTDDLGAGIGATVMYVHGRGARVSNPASVIDATTVGIIDSFEK